MTEIVTIDGKERALPPGIPVIADEEGPIAVAGVMGGLESGVGPGTTEILLESACFNPAAVRRASKALGLSTDSSYRFERGTDIEGTIPALDSAAQLIAEIAGGRVCAGGAAHYARWAWPYASGNHVCAAACEPWAAMYAWWTSFISFETGVSRRVIR